MEQKVLYSFNVYMRNPNNFWYQNGTSVSIQYDTIFTLFGSNLEDALLQIPEEYEGYQIVKVDYPMGWPNFPLFPPSTCTAGAVGVNPITGKHYLRKA